MDSLFSPVRPNQGGQTGANSQSWNHWLQDIWRQGFGQIVEGGGDGTSRTDPSAPAVQGTTNGSDDSDVEVVMVEPRLVKNFSPFPWLKVQWHLYSHYKFCASLVVSKCCSNKISL